MKALIYYSSRAWVSGKACCCIHKMLNYFVREIKKGGIENDYQKNL
jgi:hypothetical protein